MRQVVKRLMLPALVRVLMPVAYLGYFGLLMWPLLFIVFVVAVYLGTYGSDVELKAACADDTAFARFKLLIDRRGFWQDHVSRLDHRTAEMAAVPREVANRAKEGERIALEFRAATSAVDTRTPAQKAADSLRQEADRVEAAERWAVFLRENEQRIRALEACRNVARGFLTSGR